MTDRVYVPPVRHVTAGENVSAAVVGRVTKSLEAGIRAVNNQLKGISTGSALVDSSATLRSDVTVGQPVFWNASNGRYEPALAGVDENTSAGLAFTAASYCVGIVSKKLTATTGTVTFFGLTEIEDLSSVMPDGVETGLYYLSVTQAGTLTQNRPTVAIPVCFCFGAAGECDTAVRLLVYPHFGSFFDDHVHYRFNLNRQPAGEATLTAGRWEITAPDALQAGWLPADYIVDGVTPPAGAVFRYNLTQDSKLNAVWPPVPIDGAMLIWDRGDLATMGAIVPTTGSGRLVTVNADGIWWMSDCDGDVPWDGVADGSSSSSVSSATCDRVHEPQLLLTFTQMLFATNRTTVQSLQSLSPLLLITDCDGEAASTGALKIDFDLPFLLGTTTAEGALVFKELDDNSFNRGYVTEGLITTSDTVELTSTVSRLQNPSLAESAGNPRIHQGIVSINFVPDYADRDITPQLVYLEDVLERDYQDVSYLGFPTGRNSEIRAKFYIPASGLPSSPKLKLRLQLLGLLAGPFSGMTCEYRVIPRANAAAQLVEDSFTSLAIDVVTPSTGMAAKRIIEVETDAFSIAAGATVIVKLRRASTASPVYSDDIGLLRLSGIITT